MSRYTLTVFEPNGVQRTRPLTPRGLTIGRGTDNDLQIAYDMVSRRHAWVTFEGGYYYVTDLNSANGTYLGNIRLTPNEPTLWTPGTPLRVGDVFIQIGQSETAPVQQQRQAPMVIGSPGERRRRDREETHTGIGGYASPQAAKSKTGSRVVLLVLAILFLLCVCAALGAAAYYYFFV